MVPLHWLFSKTYDASQLRQVATPVDEMSHWLHPVPQPEKPVECSCGIFVCRNGLR